MGRCEVLWVVASRCWLVLWFLAGGCGVFKVLLDASGFLWIVY